MKINILFNIGRLTTNYVENTCLDAFQCWALKSVFLKTPTERKNKTKHLLRTYRAKNKWITAGPIALEEVTDPTLSSPRVPFPSPQASLSRMFHPADLLIVSSQGKDSSEQSPEESPKKQDGLAQMAPDLTVVQFIKGR